jgi:hypothetical protein
MTIKELIELLSEVDPDVEVGIAAEDQWCYATGLEVSEHLILIV